MGIGLVWPVIMAFGIHLLPESPRWDYGQGNVNRATETIAKTYGVSRDHPTVVAEIQEIQDARALEEAAGEVKWHQVFTARTMLRRIAVGMALQALQQLTGANFFFYYGTTLFVNSGRVENRYLVAVILGLVNFGATFGGLYIVEKVGRRKAMIAGALWIGICQLVSSMIFLARMVVANNYIGVCFHWPLLH
jgi:SP family sugar:H+ symporter-like MFS transporter